MRLQSSDPIFACHNTLPATKMTMMIVMTRVTKMMMMMNLTTTVTEMLLCSLSFPPPTGFDKSAEPPLIKSSEWEGEKKPGSKKVLIPVQIYPLMLNLIVLEHKKKKFHAQVFSIYK